MEKIIAIIDIETAGDSVTARNLLNKLTKDKKIENICETGKEKSLVIAEEKFYMSPISSTTLLKRSNHYGDFEA